MKAETTDTPQDRPADTSGGFAVLSLSSVCAAVATVLGFYFIAIGDPPAACVSWPTAAGILWLQKLTR